MELNIKLSLDKELEKNSVEYTGNTFASGWVEVDSAFKFPVNVMRKKDGSSLFVAYPSIRNKNDEYSNVVFPIDESLREKVNAAVMEEFKKLTLKGLHNPEIDSVRVNVLPEVIQNGNIAIKGYASIMISGFAINGITIKESSKGLFVQMPQKRDSSGQYQDIVYGTNSLMQTQIKEAVLDKYNEEARQLVKNQEMELAEKMQEQNPFLEAEKAPKV